MDSLIRFLVEDWHLIVIIILFWMLWLSFRFNQTAAEMHDRRIGMMIETHARDRENLLNKID